MSCPTYSDVETHGLWCRLPVSHSRRCWDGAGVLFSDRDFLPDLNMNRRDLSWGITTGVDVCGGGGHILFIFLQGNSTCLAVGFHCCLIFMLCVCVCVQIFDRTSATSVITTQGPTVSSKCTWCVTRVSHGFDFVHFFVFCIYVCISLSFVCTSLSFVFMCAFLCPLYLCVYSLSFVFMCISLSFAFICVFLCHLCVFLCHLYLCMYFVVYVCTSLTFIIYVYFLLSFIIMCVLCRVYLCVYFFCHLYLFISLSLIYLYFWVIYKIYVCIFW